MAYLDTFRGRVGAALAAVQRVLETNRHPVFPADVPHTYQDKYALADLMASTAIAAQLNVLESLGLSHENLLKLVAWSQGRSVTLRYQSEERCNFLREETRKEESASQHVSTTKILGVTATSTSKVITKITEYFWAYAYQYVIYAYRGNDLEERIFIAGNEGSAELKTTSNTPPHPEATVFPPQEVDITFLLNHVASDSVVVTFKINRESPKCHTPSQNPDIRKLSSGFSNLSTWFNNVSSRFTSSFLSVERSLGLAHSNFLNTTSIFSPVVPLFEASSGSKSEGAKVIVASSLIPNQDVASDSSVLSAADMNRFLTEQRRTIAEAYSNLETVFPHRRLLTAGDVRLPVIASHASAVIQDFFLADQLIESMLHSQLVAAVGKELQAHHFSEYMTFHNRKLFREEFQPRAFCYAIRRPEHYPEGLISVEREDRGSSEPIVTSVRSVEPVHPMQFSLDASTQVTFTGHRYLHAWIDHSFASSSTSGLSLVARARQFSSFIIMVGRIASAFLFEPVAALIIQNKDDLKVPLILEQIPSAKEFRDSIESLSPEQQDFAKAFRAMQLESTLFGVCVIQIKPQLEKLLRLPADSLTKEIELSQDLLELFIKYQIPSDLLSYDGDEDNTPGEKIKVVQQYVQAMKDMIEAKKAAEIKATAQASINQYFDDEPSYRERSKKKSVRKRSLRRDRSDGGMAECLSLEASAECSDPFDSAPEPPSESPSEPDAEKTPSTETAITEADVFDFTKIPGELDARFGKLDIEGALRPTIIKPAPSGWTKKYQESLLSSPATTTLNETELSTEKNKAFDLLDALSRSGSLTVDEADLHVLIASTHCFEKTLMHTLIQDNVNPIEKVERSLLIVAETVQSRPATELLKPDQLERVQEFSPNLFE